MSGDCPLDDMDPRIHALDNLEHAQWKVNFIRHLLQAHLASPWKGTSEWQAQRAEFLLRLASAEDELSVCKKAPAILQKIVEGTGTGGGDSEPVSSESAPQRARVQPQPQEQPLGTKPGSP